MILHYLIRLRPDLSAATLKDVAAYVESFSPDECIIETHGRERFIKFADERSLELFRRQFPELIENDEHHDDTPCAAG